MSEFSRNENVCGGLGCVSQPLRNSYASIPPQFRSENIQTRAAAGGKRGARVHQELGEMPIGILVANRASCFKPHAFAGEEEALECL